MTGRPDNVRSAMIEIQNHIQTIMQRLGGQNAVSRMLNCGQSTVADWVAKGYVPSHRIPELIRIGKTLRPPVRLKPNDFFVIEDKPKDEIAA